MTTRAPNRHAKTAKSANAKAHKANGVNFDAIPNGLREKRGWVLWIAGEKKPDGKFDKFPYYVNGVVRHGTQGSPSDRKQLATFDAVRTAYEQGGYDGIGLAMLPEFNLIGIDTDQCIDLLGEQSPLAKEVVGAAGQTYCEVSPSGAGLRLFVNGRFDDRKRHDIGLEVFSGKGFLTVTGNAVVKAEVGVITPDLEALLAGKFANGHNGRGGSGGERTTTFDPEDQQEVQKLESALDYLGEKGQADGYEFWRDVGFALGLAFGDDARGWDMYNRFAARSPKYNDDGNEAKMLALYRRGVENTVDKPITVASVFGKANELGWKPKVWNTTHRVERPATTAADAPEAEADPDEPADLFHPPLPCALDLDAALPPALRDFALAHAESRGHDPTAYAYAILPVIATALNRDTQVALRSDWGEFLVVWSGLVGTTGTGKSPVMSTVVKVLDPLQRKAWAEFKSQKLMAELRKDRARDSDEAAAGGDDKPRLYLYVVNDTTIEALQEAVAGNPHGVLHHKDEGAGWLNGMGKYANAAGAAAERAAYLTAWNGGPYTITRIKRGQVPIERWGLNQLFGITPAQIKEGYAEAASDGMLARMLVYEMHHEQSLPRRAGVNPRAAAEGMEELAGRLAGLPAMGLRLSPEASRLFEERATDYRQLALTLGPTEPGLAAVYAKAAPHLGRIAALFELIDAPGGSPNGVVGERAMRWSLRFMAHALGEAERLHKHVFGHDTPYDIAQRCARKILTYGKPRIEKNELLKVNVFKTASESERAAALRYLLAYKWLLDVDTIRPRGGPYFHEATAWKVNPKVHAKFADVAQREREEAARLIALMARVKAP